MLGSKVSILQKKLPIFFAQSCLIMSFIEIQFPNWKQMYTYRSHVWIPGQIEYICQNIGAHLFEFWIMSILKRVRTCFVERNKSVYCLKSAYVLYDLVNEINEICSFAEIETELGSFNGTIVNGDFCRHHVEQGTQTHINQSILKSWIAKTRWENTDLNATRRKNSNNKTFVGK